MNKAVEVGGKNNITRTVRNYADTVVHHAGQAVAGGAKILQERMVLLSLWSMIPLLNDFLFRHPFVFIVKGPVESVRYGC